MKHVTPEELQAKLDAAVNKPGEHGLVLRSRINEDGERVYWIERWRTKNDYN